MIRRGALVWPQESGTRFICSTTKGRDKKKRSRGKGVRKPPGWGWTYCAVRFADNTGSAIPGAIRQELKVNQATAWRLRQGRGSL